MSRSPTDQRDFTGMQDCGCIFNNGKLTASCKEHFGVVQAGITEADWEKTVYQYSASKKQKSSEPEEDLPA